jgi:AAA domain, putative AbiEii toxin, Type IV TA system
MLGSEIGYRGAVPTPRNLRARVPGVPGHILQPGGGEATFGVGDFKSIASAQLLPRRLTVLAGANSSGKSSLLQALLFFAQSFGETSVVINGDLVRLGEGKDVIKSGATSTTVEIRFDVETQSERQEQAPSECHRLRLTFDSPAGRAGLTIAALSLWMDDRCLLDVARTAQPPNITASDNEHVLGAVDGGGEGHDIALVVTGVTPIQFAYRVAPERLAQIVYQTLERTGTGRLNILNAILADAESSEIDQLRDLQRRFGDDEIIAPDDPALPLVFDRYAQLLVPDGWLTAPIALPSATPVGRFASLRFGMFGGTDFMPEAQTGVITELVMALNHAQQLAERTNYLGPLRDDPRVAYALGHTVAGLPVGAKGEFTAAYLLDHGNDWSNYGAPDGTMRQGTLRKAVIEWCEYLGIAAAVEVEPMGKMGHQLRLKVGGALRDPTAIGVGASQLLPVVALVLGAQSGAILLLEQPELHLHPKVQSRLADFFIRARLDVRLIVETHSENLITRLRRRVAEHQLAPEDVSVLFAAQKPLDDGESVYTEFKALSLNELGDFDVWPENFFDSLDQDAAALAKAVAVTVRAKPPDQAVG